MNAIEFSTIIEHGVIQLPKQYQEYDSFHARVIVLVDKPISSAYSSKEKLRDAFRKMEGVDMFNQIKSPTTWQKRLRDEWDWVID